MAGGKKERPRRLEPPAPAPVPAPKRRDHVADFIEFASLVVRLAFWAWVVRVVATAVPDALSAVAGRDTAFDFSFAVSASFAVSIATTGAAAVLYLKNRQLTRRISELEKERHPVIPQAERLPLEGDGGTQ